MPRFSLPGPKFASLGVLAVAVVLQSCSSAITDAGGTPPSAAPAIKFVAAGTHTCALTTAGAAYCWGFIGRDLGGNDTASFHPTPVAVAGGLTFQSLSVSRVGAVTCGLTTDAVAYCWGENGNGQIGDGTTTRRSTPTRVAGGLTFKSLAVGHAHACGVAMSGTAYCWGTSPNGALGGDESEPVQLTPAVAAQGMTFQSIVAGRDYTCALTPAGAAYCWGFGAFGQLGDGRGVTSLTPVAVSGGLTFRSLAAGAQTVCGQTTTGKAYCWGDDFYGTAGDGNSGTQDGKSRRMTPVAVAGGLTFQSLSAGFSTMCGVTDAGAGYCWGFNFGAVGDGTIDLRAIPAAVAGGLSFQSISNGIGYSCGVTTGNAVYCWGENETGELGDGTTNARTTPVAVKWP